MGLVGQNVQIDYHTLKGCLPWNAVPSDLDGILEMGGEFLVIECKFDNAPELKRGQKILLEQLSRLETFTVVVVEIDRVEQAKGVFSFLPQRWKFFVGGKEQEWSSCNLEKFIQFYKGWFNLVCKPKDRLQ